MRCCGRGGRDAAAERVRDLCVSFRGYGDEGVSVVDLRLLFSNGRLGFGGEDAFRWRVNLHAVF